MMKINLSIRGLWGGAIFLAILTTRGVAQTPAPQQPVAQAPSVCANQPMCAEGYDFAAMITDFRTSETNGVKLIDTTVHFVNKTNRPLILGYTDGSGMAIDDQGNRYAINGYAGTNAVRGIGKVVGNQIDSKFMLPPGQAGDAMFELLWRPTGGAVGQSFEFDFTTREITALEGNQFSLGGEFPLRFMGLTNGVGARPAGGTSYAPAGGALTATPPAGGAYSAAGGTTATSTAAGAYSAVTPAVNGLNAMVAPAGCPPSGGLTAVNQAAGNLPAGAQSSVSQAQSTIAGFKSMFGKKKAAAAAAAAPAAGTPCAPSTSAAASTAVPGAAQSSAPAYATPAVAAPAVATAPAPVTTAASAAGTPAAAATTPNTAMTPAQRAEAARLARLQAQQKAAADAEARRKAAAAAAAKKKAAAAASTSTDK